jgi:hypothetical protein
VAADLVVRGATNGVPIAAHGESRVRTMTARPGHLLAAT